MSAGHHLNFIYQTTKASFKLQNENSYLGIVWYLLGPLLLFGILLFVFSHRLGSDTQQYPLYLLLGIITWNFFSTGAGRAMTVFLRHAGILKALPIRRDLLVVSSVLHAFVSHSLEIILFLAIALLMGVKPVLFGVYLLVLAHAFLFTLGVGFFLGSVYLFLRDIDQIWSVITRAWWFATPIFYVALPGTAVWRINQYNPMYIIISMSRDTLIYHTVPDISRWLVLLAWTAVSIIVGYSVFLYTSATFTDHL